ncbi:Hypothetical protein, putative, partial [Bodo saltans]
HPGFVEEPFGLLWHRSHSRRRLRNSSSCRTSSPTLAVSSPTALDTHETLRYLFAESDALASTFLTVLHRVVAQCAHQFNSHGELAEGSWPKILAQKLSLCGFETFSYQVRIIRLVATVLTATTTNNSPSTAPTPPSGTAPNVVTRQIFRVIERLLLILTHYQSMRSTEVGDHEGVQEIVAAVGNSMEEAIEHLKPLFKSVSKQRMHARPMSRMVLEIKRQCFSVSNSVAVASHLAEINDHPNGQAKYDSLWAVYRATAIAEHRSTGAGPPAHFFMPSGNCSTAAPAPSSQQNRNRTSSPLDASTLLMIPLEDGKYSSCLSEAQIHRLRSIRFVRVADILEYFLRMPKSEQEHFRSNVLNLYRLTTASMEGSDGVPGGGNQ